KRHTDWIAPNQIYEQAVLSFTRSILRPRTRFLLHFHTFHAKLMDLAMLNSLTKVVLKFTCPGIPDCYQGNEGWDFSFVDPDNRRPVDFALRQAWQQELYEMQLGTGALRQLWKSRYSGQLKYS